MKNASPDDTLEAYEYLIRVHDETEYLLAYADECSGGPMVAKERIITHNREGNMVQIYAYVDGEIAGSAGIDPIGRRRKISHRAEFGVSILKKYWGLGIGKALTEACIECAKKAGYLQLELEVVNGNEAALNLYKKYGFTEYGRNPWGFRTDEGSWQELIYMRLPIPKHAAK